MNRYLDWNVEDDSENIRKSAIELRAKDAERIYLPCFASHEKAQAYLAAPRTYWRRKILEKFELLTCSPISGRILEIGAGTGWCSAVLSKKDTVKEVFALDYSRYCVEQLMPQVFKTLEAHEYKIIRVLGSYNAMRCKDSEFNLVVSIGAIHHSENLDATLQECFRVLRPGGYLLATEPCEYNSLTVEEQGEMSAREVAEKEVEKKWGGEVGTVRKMDNSDHLYRLCEYEAAGIAAGFNVLSYVFDASRKSGGILSSLQRAMWGLMLRDYIFKMPSYRGFQRNIAYPFFAKYDYFSLTPAYDRLMLVLHKPIIDLK